MMRKKNRITDIFPILLFLVFTLSALGIVTFSVQIYRGIVERAEGRYNTETAAAYLSEKFRNHDISGSIGVSSFSGCKAITIEETIKEEPYITYIYVYDGYLRELFTKTSEAGSCSASSGNEILPMQTMDIKNISDNLLKVDLVDPEGKEEVTFLSIKSATVVRSATTVKTEGADAGGGS